MTNSKTPRFDKAFLETRRRRLLQLREQLKNTADKGEADEAAVEDSGALQAHEYEDDAQKLAALETDGNLVSRDAARLARVSRALEKIDEGTYGFSDVSGKPIPDERLEAMPEAVNTVQEQAASERPR
jgi:DnaK suppressor protein